MSFFHNIENEGAAWPKPLRMWRQTHLVKPNKPPGCLDSLRPLSIGSVWYRAWSHIRNQHLSTWIQDIMPPQLHGGIRKQGIHTALLHPLSAIEAQQAHIQQHNSCSDILPTYIGTAGLIKAFDRLWSSHSINAFNRMNMPTGLRAIGRAWENQIRWLQTGSRQETMSQPKRQHTSELSRKVTPSCSRSYPPNCYHNGHGNHHAAFLDDRTWSSTSPAECMNHNFKRIGTLKRNSWT